MERRREYDNLQKQRITAEIQAQLAEGERAPLSPVVCGFWDYLGDSKKAICNKCGIKVCIRPWLLDLAQKHNLSILCVNCVDPNMLTQQIIKDNDDIQKRIDRSPELTR